MYHVILKNDRSMCRWTDGQMHRRTVENMPSGGRIVIMGYGYLKACLDLSIDQPTKQHGDLNSPVHLVLKKQSYNLCFQKKN